MTPLGKIKKAAEQRGISFILIGGLAVIEHGYARLTSDFDLLVLRDDDGEWRALLQELGYQLFHQGPTFLQYKKDTDWPVDLKIGRAHV